MKVCGTGYTKTLITHKEIQGTQGKIIKDESFIVGKNHTPLQSVMNTKFSKHGFWHCHEDGLNKMIQTIPYNL